MSRRRLVVAMAVALTLGACDWGPRGSGQLRGIVLSAVSPVGAIVIEVSGPGVKGFSEDGQTRVFFAEPQTDVHRVVLVGADPDRIRFRVDVDDVEGTRPTVVVVEAVDDSNALITDLGGIMVELMR